MENLEQSTPMPEVQKKKTWQEPIVDLISKADIENGAINGAYEISGGTQS